MSRAIDSHGIDSADFDRLMRGGRRAEKLGSTFKRQVGEAVIEMCRQRSGVEYSLRDIFPHEREFRRN